MRRDFITINPLYTNKEEADYIAGVAEFRTYMTAYLCLEDGASELIYCATVDR